MERNDGANRQAVAGQSKNFLSENNPQFSLVGNFLREDIKGEEFPEAPSVNFQCKIVVMENACLAMKGRGRLFVPITLLTKLSQGVSQTTELHEITAAPGLPPIPTETVLSDSKNRSDVVEEHINYYNWYWKCLVQAIKPVDDYIPNRQITLTEKEVVFILDDHIDLNDLEEEEKVKYREYQNMEPSGNQPSHTVHIGSSHGTRVFKFVAATSTSCTEIHFIKVGESHSDNVINFGRVAQAFANIIDSTRNHNVVWINCSFTLPPLNDPSVLIEPGLFNYLHETIHKMGFIIFGAAGNAGFETPHHPWCACQKCIVVGAEDHVTQKIADFSSGCCDPSVDVMTRGTNFAVFGNQNQFSGTSFYTAILSGAFSFIIPHIWTLDDWNKVHDVVKKFIVSTSDKKLGRGPDRHPHVPIQWNKFNFPTAINDLVLSGMM